jgi:hypothetical protein
LMASLISLYMYFDLVESSLVSCNLMVWFWLILCSATADFSGWASLMCLVTETSEVKTQMPGKFPGIYIMNHKFY